jgi:hypothetical protein
MFLPVRKTNVPTPVDSYLLLLLLLIFLPVRMCAACCCSDGRTHNESFELDSEAAQLQSAVLDLTGEDQDAMTAQRRQYKCVAAAAVVVFKWLLGHDQVLQV